MVPESGQSRKGVLGFFSEMETNEGNEIFASLEPLSKVYPRKTIILYSVF